MRYILRYLRLIVMFLFGNLLALGAHEMGHTIAVKVLGGEGRVLYNFYSWLPFPTSGHMEWTTIPDHNLWIVYLAGGLFAGLLFFPFWREAWLSPTKQDMYLEATMAALIMFEVLYAPTELILYFFGKQLFLWASIASQIVAVIIFMVLYIKKIADWVNKTCGRKNGNGTCNY